MGKVFTNDVWMAAWLASKATTWNGLERGVGHAADLRGPARQPVLTAMDAATDVVNGRLPKALVTPQHQALLDKLTAALAHPLLREHANAVEWRTAMEQAGLALQPA